MVGGAEALNRHTADAADVVVAEAGAQDAVVEAHAGALAAEIGIAPFGQAQQAGSDQAGAAEAAIEAGTLHFATADAAGREGGIDANIAELAISDQIGVDHADAADIASATQAQETIIG